MSVHIDKIRIDGGTQSRAALSEATVAEYADAMADPAVVFPPVIVYFDGKEYWLADGFHRLAAWAQIGRTEIPTEIRQGDRRRAILHSVAANSAHGLRRTNDDKRRAVLTLLEDEEWSQWSGREIARRCAVSEAFVRSLRTERSEDQPQERTYTTKHGTQAAMQTAKIGATSKPDQEIALVETDEEAPAEEIAPEVAAVMRKHAPLTREALLRDYAELTVAAAHERAKDRADIQRLKDQIAELEHDDQNAVVRALQAKLRNADSEKLRAAENLRKAMSKNYALNKRVEELEKMGVVVL